MDAVTESAGLTSRDYARVFEVLERVDAAPDLPTFREQLLEALGSVLGYRQTTFFSGATYSALFHDPAPLLNGKLRGLISEYRVVWNRHDVFTLPQAFSLLERTHAASVTELRGLPPDSREYVSRMRVQDLGSVNALYLRPAGGHALVGVFGGDGLVAASDMAMLRLLGRQLSALSRHLPAEDLPRFSLDVLPVRQREVADLVCDGHTNAVIARTLGLREDTVKKYVSRILVVAGCRSRTELVLCTRRWA